MNLDADIDLLLAAGEDLFSDGEQTVNCFLMQHDSVMGESPEAAGIIQGAGYVLLRASLFPDLAEGDPVTLNDVPYSVAQQPMKVQDGRVLQVWLGAAPESGDDGNDAP